MQRMILENYLEITRHLDQRPHAFLVSFDLMHNALDEVKYETHKKIPGTGLIDSMRN